MIQPAPPPPDVITSIGITVSILIAFATWMLTSRDSEHVPAWHGLVYILSVPFVIALHIVGAPLFAFATIRSAWDRHVRNHRARQEGDAVGLSTWKIGDKKW